MAEVENTKLDSTSLLAGLNLTASVLSNELLQQATSGLDSEVTWQTLYDLASQAQPAEREDLAKATVSFAEEHLGPQDPRMTDALKLLGEHYVSQEQYQEALDLISNSLKALGHNADWNTSERRLEFAALVRIQAECNIKLERLDKGYDLACEVLKALEVYTDRKDLTALEANVELARTLDVIGDTFVTCGSYDRAIIYYKVANTYWLENFAWDTPEVTDSLYRIGKADAYRGEWMKAEGLLGKAVLTKQGRLEANGTAEATDKDHQRQLVAAAEALYALVEVASFRGEKDRFAVQKKEFYRLSKEIGHHIYPSVLAFGSSRFAELESNEKTEDRLDAALRLNNEIFGLDNPSRVPLLMTWGRLCFQQDNLPGAIQALENAWKLAERYPEPAAKFMEPVLEFLIGYHDAQGSIDRSIELRHELIKFLSNKPSTPENAQKISNTTRHLILFYGELGFTEKATELAGMLCKRLNHSTDHEQVAIHTTILTYLSFMESTNKGFRQALRLSQRACNRAEIIRLTHPEVYDHCKHSHMIISMFAGSDTALNNLKESYDLESQKEDRNELWLREAGINLGRRLSELERYEEAIAYYEASLTYNDNLANRCLTKRASLVIGIAEARIVLCEKQRSEAALHGELSLDSLGSVEDDLQVMGGCEDLLEAIQSSRIRLLFALGRTTEAEMELARFTQDFPRDTSSA